MMRGVINLPNLLTLARILLTPFIIWAILNGFPSHALALMIVAGLTDMLDGFIAKHYGMQTVVGAYMDPIADKLMLTGAFISLFITGQAPMFLFLAVVFRDVVIVIGAIAYELVTHRLKMQPTWLSKTTTVFQIALVVVTLLRASHPVPDALFNALVWLTFALTCASGIQYMVLWTYKATRAEGAG